MLGIEWLYAGYAVYPVDVHQRGGRVMSAFSYYELADFFGYELAAAAIDHEINNEPAHLWHIRKWSITANLYAELKVIAEIQQVPPTASELRELLTGYLELGWIGEINEVVSYIVSLYGINALRQETHFHSRNHPRRRKALAVALYSVRRIHHQSHEGAQNAQLTT